MAQDPNRTASPRSDNIGNRLENGHMAPPSTPYVDYERNLGGALGGRPAARERAPVMEEAEKENAGGVDRFRFKGVGPKGYTRSDARIHEEVSDRLAEDGELDPSEVEVSVNAREVTLNGFVWSRQDKRRAEDIADSVSGVTHVQNNLRVRPPARR